MRILALTLLFACAKEQSLVEVLEPEVVCTHPSSIYEAQMVVAYPDYSDIEAIEFILEQEGEYWTTWLQVPDDNNPYWHTRMQLMEFDCKEEYYYDFIEVLP